jgi:peptidoglycan/xylan/chitin deacetylase (PgdA/CDA1 family)
MRLSDQGQSVIDMLLRTALHALSPAGRGGRLSIVIFHRVLPAPDPLFPGDMDRDRFSRVCAWFSAWFNVMPLDEALRRQAEGGLPERALAITFDDGYADNHDIAMPILRAHRLSATFFIATGFLNGGRMWNDTVVESLRRCSDTVMDLSPLGLPGLGRLHLDSYQARRQATYQLLEATKYLPIGQREAMANRIARSVDASLPQDLMMTTSQVRAMLAAGMQIGAHTINHPILSSLDDVQAHAEIAGGKAALEALIQYPVTLFAYPNGKPGRDYRARDVSLVRKAGFEAAVSTASGVWRPAREDCFQIPRFTPWDTRRWAFGTRMARNYLATPARV